MVQAVNRVLPVHDFYLVSPPGSPGSPIRFGVCERWEVRPDCPGRSHSRLCARERRQHSRRPLPGLVCPGPVRRPYSATPSAADTAPVRSSPRRLLSCVLPDPEQRERLAALWLRVSRMVGAAIAPAMLGLFAVAPDFVRVVLGQRWQAVTPVLQILSFVTLMQGFTAVAQRALVALGSPGLVFRNSALRTALAVAAFVAGLHWGIVGVAAFYTGVTIPAQVYMVEMVTRTLGISRRRYLHNLVGVAQAAVLMFAGCMLARMPAGAHRRWSDAALARRHPRRCRCLLARDRVGGAPEDVVEVRSLRGRRARARRRAAPVSG